METNRPTPMVQTRAAKATSLADRIRASARPSIPFVLTETTVDGVEARVQRPSLVFMMQNGLVPQHTAKLVTTLVQQRDNLTAATELIEADPMKTMAELQDIIDATCVAGFIEPVLVAAEADETADRLWVKRIDGRDRERFFNWCQGKDVADAAAIKSGPGEESAPGAVDPGPEGVQVRGAAEFAAGMGLAARGDEV